MDTRRFNTPEYKDRMRAIRAYKRPVQRGEPERGVRKVLEKTGMHSLRNRIFLGLGLAVLVYLIYFAPFLRVKSFSIQGADQDESQAITNLYQSFSRQYVYGLPQKNFLLFNRARFSEVLLASDFKIAQVNSFSKKFFKAQIVLDVNQRVPAYLIQAQNGLFVLNSDGAVSSQVDQGQSGQTGQAQMPKLPVIIDSAAEDISRGEQIFDQGRYSFLDYVNSNLNSRTGAHVDHFQIAAKVGNDLTLFTKEGYRVMFDDSADPKVSLDRLFKVLTNISPAQQKNLAYIDLRFDPNAYGCYKTDKCAQ